MYTYILLNYPQQEDVSIIKIINNNFMALNCIVMGFVFIFFYIFLWLILSFFLSISYDILNGFFYFHFLSCCCFFRERPGHLLLLGRDLVT